MGFGRNLTHFYMLSHKTQGTGLLNRDCVRLYWCYRNYPQKKLMLEYETWSKLEAQTGNWSRTGSIDLAAECRRAVTCRLWLLPVFGNLSRHGTAESASPKQLAWTHATWTWDLQRRSMANFKSRSYLYDASHVAGWPMYGCGWNFWHSGDSQNSC